MSKTDFNEIKVSTKTFTVSTNLILNIKDIFTYLPITPYKLKSKKRGRKSSEDLLNDNTNKCENKVKKGSIITIKYEDKIRGMEIRPRKNKKKKWFRNSITIVMMLDKPINFKICLNGTFQMTGCKSIRQAKECVKIFWDMIYDRKDLWYKKTEKDDIIKILFIPCMRNIDFSVGYLVDREKLNDYIFNNIEKFHCLLETSFGYTGVNIKIPVNRNITDIDIDKMTWNESEKIWDETIVKYDEYLSTLNDRMVKHKLDNTRYNTFLVFHSGKVIMSGINKKFMENDFYKFMNIMSTSRKYIEEKLDI